jgi:hypothetical protein
MPFRALQPAYFLRERILQILKPVWGEMNAKKRREAEIVY